MREVWFNEHRLQYSIYSIRLQKSANTNQKADLTHTLSGFEL